MSQAPWAQENMLVAAKFLDAHVIRSSCEEAGLDTACAQAVIDFAAGILVDSELSRHATAARDHLFDAAGEFAATVAPAEIARLGFRVLSRPVAIRDIVAAAAQAMKH